MSKKIRIDPVSKEGLGVFFVDAAGTETPVTHPFTQNDLKKVTCRMTALAAGVYTLKIVTQYSNSTVHLKEPRTIICEMPLTVA